jgi:hypothetical protein
MAYECDPQFFQPHKMAKTCDPQLFKPREIANTCDPQLFKPRKIANTCDPQLFQPARAFNKEKILDGSPSSNNRSQDKEFIPTTATKFGGVIQIGPGIWKSVYRLSSRGVEFCPEHEASALSAVPSEQLAGVRLLEQVSSSSLLLGISNHPITLSLFHHIVSHLLRFSFVAHTSTDTPTNFLPFLCCGLSSQS